MVFLTVPACHFLSEEGEVNTLIIIGVDVKVLDAGAGVIHKLAQGPRRDGPVVRGQILLELGPHRWLSIEW